MAWTSASFKVRWPEFAATDDSVVQATLADAATYVDPALFGDDTDQAVGLKCADMLAQSPYGESARLDSKGKPDAATTTYDRAFQRLCRARAGGPWAIGQGASGPVP